MGEDLVGAFMWMFEVQLIDGRALHAYKHINTRRYLHLDLAGGAFLFTGADYYRRIALADALEAVLSPWWERLNASVEDIAASWSAIERARRRDEYKPGGP